MWGEKKVFFIFNSFKERASFSTCCTYPRHTYMLQQRILEINFPFFFCIYYFNYAKVIAMQSTVKTTETKWLNFFNYILQTRSIRKGHMIFLRINFDFFLWHQIWKLKETLIKLAIKSASIVTYFCCVFNLGSCKRDKQQVHSDTQWARCECPTIKHYKCYVTILT